MCEINLKYIGEFGGEINKVFNYSRLIKFLIPANTLFTLYLSSLPAHNIKRILNYLAGSQSKNLIERRNIFFKQTRTPRQKSDGAGSLTLLSPGYKLGIIPHACQKEKKILVAQL